MGEFDDTPISELYDEGQAEAEAAQAEAEQWADENGMDTWSNGDVRTNTNLDEDSDDSFDENPENEPQYDSITEDSEKSVSELYDEGHAEAEAAQAEAERWADENGMDTWSNGDVRTNANLDEDSDDSFDENPENESQYDSITEDSEKSVSELYDEGHAEAEAAQSEAERWADENGMDTWSDGDARTNANTDAENASSGEMPESNNFESENTDMLSNESDEDNNYAPLNSDIENIEEDDEDFRREMEEESRRLQDLKEEEERVAADNDYAKLHDMKEQYKQLDRDYENAKRDINSSNSDDERNYWNNRADSIWNERDKLGGEMEDYIRSRNK